ncbi:MAG: hypothetical protein AABY33_05810 [Pseudomonadota bacterium]
MHWHFEDIPLLIHNLPRALHDLMQHEDKSLVNKGVKTILKTQPPLVSIEKTLDPMAQRSAQNIGLLLHDYLQQLPSFDVSHAEGEKLLEHWREIMIEQPQRLATAHQSHWHDESSKAFWHDKIASHHTDFGITSDSFPDAWDDWQRASGIGHNVGNPKQLSVMKQKQWQDLVIRSRLHKETMTRWNEG